MILFKNNHFYSSIGDNPFGDNSEHHICTLLNISKNMVRGIQLKLEEKGYSFDFKAIDYYVHSPIGHPTICANFNKVEINIYMDIDNLYDELYTILVKIKGEEDEEISSKNLKEEEIYSFLEEINNEDFGRYKYYIIYEITDHTNGMKYIGKHMTDNLEDGYMGSGTLLKQNQKLKGIENFSRKILHYCKNKKHMNEMERIEIEKVKAYENNNYYNLM